MTKMISRRTVLQGGVAAAATLAAAPSFAAGWTPQKPIEMVIMAGQGGGADRLARLFQTIIQKNNLSSMPILPINKGGGSGAEALRYLKDKAGDPHVIMATLNSYYTTHCAPILASTSPNSRRLRAWRWIPSRCGSTPTARSPASSSSSRKCAPQAARGRWRHRHRRGRQPCHRDAGAGIRHQVQLHPLQRGGDVAKALVGGHIDSTVNNPSEQLAFHRAGKSRILGAFTPERIGVFPETPTMRELGHDLVYGMQRSFVAPSGLTAEQTAFHIDLMTRLSQTAEWQEYAGKNALVTDLLTGDDLQAYFLEERDKHAALLSALAA